MACQPNREGGCPRCIIPSPTICCSLHTPDRFKTFARTDTDKTNGKTRRSRVDDKYEADAVDMQLRNALNTFRRDQTTSIFGWAALINLGPALIMSDEVLHRIVDCAHVHKIRTKEDLVKETQWPRAQEDGDAVLAIVATHRPLPASTPAPTTTPLHPQSMNHAPATLPSTPTPKPSKLASKCGACGIRGHIGTSLFCFHLPNCSDFEFLQLATKNVPSILVDRMQRTIVPWPVTRPWLVGSLLPLCCHRRVLTLLLSRMLHCLRFAYLRRQFVLWIVLHPRRFC